MSARGWWLNAGLLVLAALAAYSPLPEALLGRWLLLENDSRIGHGRAHERRNLVTQGKERVQEINQELELRRLAAAGARSLPLLARALETYPELDLSSGAFLELYASLSPGQQDMLVPPSELRSLTSQEWRKVRLNLQAGRLRCAFLDQNSGRLSGCETGLSALLLQPLGLKIRSRIDTTVRLEGLRALQHPDSVSLDSLEADQAEVFERLRLHPGIVVKELIWNQEGRLYFRIGEAGSRDLLVELPEIAKAREPDRRRWFGF